MCQLDTAVSLSYREDWHTQCIVWKGLKELASQYKLVYLVVDISDNLMEA